jgi:hypothetical protein
MYKYVIFVGGKNNMVSNVSKTPTRSKNTLSFGQIQLFPKFFALKSVFWIPPNRSVLIAESRSS